MKTKKELKDEAVSILCEVYTERAINRIYDLFCSLIARLPDDPPRRALYTVRAGEPLPEMPSGAKVVSIFGGQLSGLGGSTFLGGYAVAITVELPE